jgi:hypothetical protein
MKDLELMRIRADTGFTYDERGRMVLSNEPREEDRRPAPRLFLGRTLAGHVLRFGATAPDTLVGRLEECIERHASISGLSMPPDLLTKVREILTRHAPVTTQGGGPAYRFPTPIATRGEAVQLTDANRGLAHDTFPWLYDQCAEWQPCYAVVRDGAAVSVCFSARVGILAEEAGVETLPDFRGHGFAAAVTTAWGIAVRESGRIPLYSTSWDNLASQGVARRVGLIRFGADLTLA